MAPSTRTWFFLQTYEELLLIKYTRRIRNSHKRCKTKKIEKVGCLPSDINEHRRGKKFITPENFEEMKT